MNTPLSSSPPMSLSTSTPHTEDDNVPNQITTETKTADQSFTVVYDYQAKNEDELTLRRGIKLEVLSKDSRISGGEGWWAGKIGESIGVFPSNFVTTITPAQTQDGGINVPEIHVDDLTIGEIIGSGGFGHVYYGRYRNMDVAIKTAKSFSSTYTARASTTTTSSPKMDLNNNDDLKKTVIENLLREAKLFWRLKHRNIISLIGVSYPNLSTDNLYLIMEYARGSALSQLLQLKKTGLYPNVWLEYAKQIAAGMNYLHEEACEHIIHRDLKSSNILILEPVDVNDENDLLHKTLKITDFGLARQIQLQTSNMSAAGTYAWMSPECIRDSVYSTKSDVWGFGVVMWECLTGEIPYRGFDQLQIAFGIATNKYTLPIPTTCPDSFSQLITSCWQKEPNDRPSFFEILNQLTDIEEETSSADMSPTNESFHTMQQDWRNEIQEMFQELKEKEKEIRDRESLILKKDLEQHHLQIALSKWEKQLHERELFVIECELRLIMGKQQEHNHHSHTPKPQKRSGRFMRSLITSPLQTSSTHLSQTNKISSPINFRHLISVCRDQDNHHFTTTADHTDSYISIPNTPPSSSASSSSPISCPSAATLASTGYRTDHLSSSPKKSFHNGSLSYTPNSTTPSTPTLNRLRTLHSSRENLLEFSIENNSLDVHFPLFDNITDNVLKSSRSATTPPSTSSATTTLLRRKWRTYHRKSTSCSSSTMKKKQRSNTGFGKTEATWYYSCGLDNITAGTTAASADFNTNNNNNGSNNMTNHERLDGLQLKPIGVAMQNLVLQHDHKSSSATQSSDSITNHEKCLSHALFHISSMISSIGFGRHLPHPSFSSNHSSSLSHKIPSTPKCISSTLHCSAGETTTPIILNSLSSTPDSSIRLNYDENKRTSFDRHCLSTSDEPRERSKCSPQRPNSLILSSPSPAVSLSRNALDSLEQSATGTQCSYSDLQVADSDKKQFHEQTSCSSSQSCLTKNNRSTTVSTSSFSSSFDNETYYSPISTPLIQQPFNHSIH
ncbi:unnamed protein product [Didymodactylos carnosus]|uniref:mitogen-activated protein kinase kinase kinase n=1 Tax=Didymodactylos carnosus TaxID=1234261 RepID=A0A813T2E9_9BILA|nr:unnamed protein product [Didymodactylos carnosus]CAF1034126.1 unnamed protein product [Didymodactylos carnosus]CAF3594171.1 unnamed protein product [Didymodactylos carnosus]CAF3802317.1 unnamed protein product [Didymodactylos carnosus]